MEPVVITLTITPKEGRDRRVVLAQMKTLVDWALTRPVHAIDSNVESIVIRDTFGGSIVIDN